MPLQDKKLVCIQCGQEFLFTVDEQEFYARKGLSYDPKRCKACRQLKKADQSGGNKNYSKQLYDVICAKCGKNTQVPFKPMQGRPVYCRQCYQLIR